jgi:DNA-binding PadR family transcriptional regulator
MRRSLHFFWPRAESNLYAEPKRLVAAGLAEAHEEWNGDRRRTVYSITDRGREALRDWLATPPGDSRLESEAHLRVLYGNYGSKDELLGAIAAIEDDAQRTIDHYTRVGTEYARGEGPFPDRIHVNALITTLSIEQARAPLRWGRWAHAAVEAWETTETPDVEWAAAALLRAARDAESDQTLDVDRRL